MLPDFEFEELDELGIDSHVGLRLEGGFDDELGTLSNNNTKAFQAASALRDYLIRTNEFGSDNNKIPEIAGYQRDMGMGSNAIGIVGPMTRNKASALGVTLPQKKATSTNNAKQAAASLKDYLTNTGDFGSKAQPSQNVKSFQTQMGGLVNDGIVGPKTRARAQALGVSLPSASTPKASPKAPSATPSQCATALSKYLARTNSYGTKTNPDATVKHYQSCMGGLVADGIVGPKTNARAKALGVTLPAQQKVTIGQAVITKPKTNDNNKKAAIGLRDYLIKTKDFGDDKHRSSNVAAYQKAMGMGTNAIGIVGPKTRALASKLGATLPPRPVSHPSVTKVPAKHAAVTPVSKLKQIANHPIVKQMPANQKAALMLQQYLLATKDFGTKAKPSDKVKGFQGIMGGLVNDGIIGPKTAARAKALGYALPNRPTSSKSLPKKTVTTKSVTKHKIATKPKTISKKQATAKAKLSVIGKLSDEYPDFPIWDTFKFRRRVMDLLRVAAGV